MSYLKWELISHTRKVCSLYKRALRNVEAIYERRPRYRYHCVVMRQRFEEHRHEPDMRVAKKLLEDGEEELFEKMHHQPIYFPTSVGGVAHEREVHCPDWVLDYWHPLEKEQYPEYFARREQRKKEYLEKWDKQHGKPTPEELGH